MNWLNFLAMVKVFVPIIHSFGENGSGVWDHDLSTPSVVYPLYVSAKSQGFMRIFVRPRTTILSSTVLTTILSAFDDLIEDYLKRREKIGSTTGTTKETRVI
ncbi:unnamed protein product [Rotaria magnacalcarata]